MPYSFDVVAIRSILNNLRKITDINFAFFDDKMNTITYSMPRKPFCHAIRRVPEGDERCVKCDFILKEKCIKEKKPASIICHAGLCDTIVPVTSPLDPDKILGYITFGQIPVTDDFDKIYENISDIVHDKETQRTNYALLAPHDEAFINSIIEILNSGINQAIANQFINPDTVSIVQSVTEYINSNIASNLSVDTICTIFHISRSTLFRKFNESIGCSVKEYIMDQRIKKACSLLEKTHLTVQDISEGVGIFNYYYFFKAFKKATGLTPVAYRQKFTK